jgi:hypothetical protein
MLVLFGMNGRAGGYRLANEYKYAARGVESDHISRSGVVQTFHSIYLQSHPTSQPRITNHHELRNSEPVYSTEGIHPQTVWERTAYKHESSAGFEAREHLWPLWPR